LNYQQVKKVSTRKRSFSRILGLHAKRLLGRTYVEWKGDNVPRLGAALAFYSVLSLAPMLLLALSAATFVWGREAAQGHILDQITDIFGAHAATAFHDVLTTTSNEKHTGLIASCVGVFMLLFSASGMFNELQAAMNIIWKVRPSGSRPLWALFKERLFSFVMVIGSGFFLIASLLVSAVMAAAVNYINTLLPEARILMKGSDFLVSLLITTLLFATMFKVIPERSIPWRSVWAGALLTSLLFVAGKTLIGFYLGHVGVASTYGAAGSLVVLLLWIYYSVQILFLGAEFTYVYSCHFKLHKDAC